MDEHSYFEVCDVVDFPETGRLVIDLDGQQVLIINIDDEYFAISEMCTHAKISLFEGVVEDYQISCPKHGARFEVRNGKEIRMPAQKDLITFPVKVENEKILIGVVSGSS